MSTDKTGTTTTTTTPQPAPKPDPTTTTTTTNPGTQQGNQPAPNAPTGTEIKP